MISAVVLAGGKSSRMGCNKVELPYCSVSLVQFQVQKLANFGITDLMVSGYDKKKIHGTRHVADVHKGKGPLGGIHAALVNANHPSCLVLGVDTPLIPDSLLHDLMDAHERNPYPITVVFHSGQLEPLVGIYDRSLAYLAEQLIMQECTSVRRFLDQATHDIFSYEGDESIFLNCNTPEDYTKLLMQDR